MGPWLRSAAWTLLLAFVLVAGPAIVGTADAAEAGQGFFVFVVNDANNGTVYRAERDGTGLRPLTPAHGCRVFGPRVSPDGRAVFYSTWDGRQQKMWRMSADGTARRCLTTSQYNEAFGGFSPDGTRLVFSSNRGAFAGCRVRLWTMSPEGADLRVVSRRPLDIENAACYAPDGKRIAFSGSSPGMGGDSIWLYDVRTGTRQRVARPPAGTYWQRPLFSPDGRQILCVAAHPGRECGEMFLITVATRARRIFGAPCRDARYPCFADQGKAIAYVDATDYAIYVHKIGRDPRGRIVHMPGRRLDTLTFWEPTKTK